MTNEFSRHRLFLFDWSGTVSDDREQVYEANMRLRAKYGQPRLHFCEWAEGKVWNTARYLCELLKAVPEAPALPTLYQQYGEIFDQVQAEQGQAQAYPGAADLFGAIIKQGKRIEVISSHPQAHLQAEIARYGLGSFVARATGSVSDKAPVITQAYREADIEPGQTAYIGDMVADLQEARRAEVTGVAVTHGYHSRALLTAQNPSIVIGSLPELLAYI